MIDWHGFIKNVIVSHWPRWAEELPVGNGVCIERINVGICGYCSKISLRTRSALLSLLPRMPWYHR